MADNTFTPVPTPKPIVPSEGGDWFGDLDLGNIVSGAVDIAGSVFGSESQREASAAASDSYAEAIQRSADIMGAGYDTQLGHLEEGSDVLRAVSDAGLTDVTGQYQMTDEEFAQAMRDAYSTYGQFILPRVDEYGREVFGATDQFIGDIGATAQTAGDILVSGSEGFQEAYSPYTETGQKALQYLQSVMAADPSQMTPEQRRMYDDAQRNAMATLAASGLRGAGRGGVASVVEGMNALDAAIFDANQARADQAAYELARTGYTATGKQAADTRQLASGLSNLAYQTGQQGAQQKFNVASDVAKTGLNTAFDIGGKQYGAESAIAQHGSGTGQNIAGNIGSYYSNIGNIEGGRHQARGDIALGKAATEASAAGQVGAQDYYRDQADSQLKGNTIGSVTSVLSKVAKDTLPDKINIEQRDDRG